MVGHAFGKGALKFWQSFITKWVATAGSISVWGFILIFLISSDLTRDAFKEANMLIKMNQISGAEWTELIKSILSSFFTLMGSMVGMLMAVRKVASIFSTKPNDTKE